MAPAKKAAKKAATKKATAKKSTRKATAKNSTTKATAKKAGAKKTAKKGTRRAAADKPMLVSKSKIKETLKSHGKRTDSTLVDALNDEIHGMLQKAATRAEGNKRGTVRPGDL
jgi:DNA-binding protein HU-beta